MPAWPEVTVAGAVIGLLFGLFGVGGSSFATPVLGLLGVPGLAAVASPLPATIPAAIVGAAAYVRRGELDRDVARWSMIGGAPATVLGALLSRSVGGKALLIASGVVLAVVGVRILAPITSSTRLAGRARRRAAVVVPAAAGIGFFTGLLANGGGFLLVPLFVLVLGLTMPESAGTSLVVIAVLSIPTLATHWVLGHIDWTVAAAFAAGAIPGALAGSRLVSHLPADRLRKSFGVLLIGFAVYFTLHQSLA
ncbi:MAG: sulfite exporter TauE/SafE family protein [Acidimicrobiales bacterium]